MAHCRSEAAAGGVATWPEAAACPTSVRERSREREAADLGKENKIGGVRELDGTESMHACTYAIDRQRQHKDNRDRTSVVNRQAYA